MTAAAPAVTVVVMAYDEVASLEGVVREIEGALASPGSSHEILIVDDGSKDGTGELADRLALMLPAVRVVHHSPNEGLGGVYRTGFAEARGELVTFFPADGQFPAATILPRFVEAAARVDLVLGYLPGRRRTPLGRTLSWAERLLYRILFGPMPRFEGVFMLRRAVLGEIELRSSGRGWAIVMEMIIRVSRARYRIENLPTDLRPRAHGQSKVQNVRTILANLRQAFTLRRDLARRSPGR